MKKLLLNDFWKKNVKKKKKFSKFLGSAPFSRVGRETGDKTIFFSALDDYMPGLIKAKFSGMNAQVPHSAAPGIRNLFNDS